MLTNPVGLIKRQPPSSPLEADVRPAKKTRRRITLACEECRVRKRRCDGATPACAGCVKRMSACVYSSELQARTWRNSMIGSLRDRLEELERQEELSQGPETVGRSAEPRINGTNSSPLPTNAERGQADVAEAVGEMQPPVSCQPVSRGGTTGNVRDHPVNLAAMSPTSSSAPPNRSSGGLEPCSVERLMEPIDKVMMHRGDQGPRAVPHLPGLRSSGSNVSPCSCDQILDDTQCSLPLKRHADRLVDIYFNRVQRVYPILHERTFAKQYEGLWQSASRAQGTQTNVCSLLCKQRSQGKTFPAMLNAVFALASLFESGPPEQNTAQAQGFFRQAQAIDLLEILDNEVGVELIQLGLLMGFYLQSTERFSKCWNITGLTIRMAQNIGLQLSFSEALKKGLLPSSITQAEWEMRVRVWYGCVLLDREISMSFGRPLMISEIGESLKLPEPIDDSFLSDERGKWNAQPQDTPSLLNSYIQTIKLYDILGEVLQREERKHAKSASSRPGTPIEATIDTGLLLSLDTKIMDWRDALPSYLKYDPSTEENVQGSRPPELLAQAKRLYTRFLHIRVLILRPALDLLLQNQRAERPTQIKRSRETRVQELMLSDIAAECVYSADKLVHFLDTQIRSHTLVAWWYNISYLHTCGSTLLMSQLCTFTNSDSLGSSAWERCLQCISRYTGLSSIAQKSYRLLQESAKRLLPRGPIGNDEAADDTENMQSHQDQAAQSIPMADHSSQPSNIPVDGIPDPYFHPQAHGSDRGGAPQPDAFPGDLWADEVELDSYWSFTPFLSQLEVLPANFGPANLHR